MSPDDFPQFDDPRVREVMAAAANLVEYCSNMAPPSHCWDELDALKTALFAAQHSRPKCDCYDDGVGSVLGPLCQVHRPAQHSKPSTPGCSTLELARRAREKPVTNRFNVDGSKPGGKAFIAAVEETKCDWSKNRLRLGESDD